MSLVLIIYVFCQSKKYQKKNNSKISKKLFYNNINFDQNGDHKDN